MLALELIDLSEESFSFLQRVRQDPAVQKYGSFSLDLDSADMRWRYFSSSHIAPPVFISFQGLRIGYIRFRPSYEVGCCEISLLLIPEYQHQGLGIKALKLAEQYAQRQGITSLIAFIKKENNRSIRLFEKAEYHLIHENFPYVTDYIKRVDEPNKEKVQLYKKQLITQHYEQTNKLFIIAEIGSNWIVGSQKKNREMAKTLISLARDSGCDAVKFQVYKAHETYAVGSGASSYLQQCGIHEEIQSLLSSHQVECDEIPYLSDLAKSYDIEFMATSFSEPTFSMIEPYVQRHKIASYEISDPVMLNCVAKSQKPLLLSTGASTLHHISWALSYLEQCGFTETTTLLQCTAAYPALIEDAQISVLKTLKSSFGCPVGLSDHTEHPTIAPILAIGFGATVIEKHITLSKKLPGPDHFFALEPHELQEMVKACRSAKKMIGNGQKMVQSSEEELFFFAQRALQATASIEKNDLISVGENAAFLRPGNQKKGLHPIFLPCISGKRAIHNIEIGSGINIEDVE